MKDDPQVQRAVSQYQLGLPRSPVAGRAGELLGRGTGSSLEFLEHREYAPGDDVRHLDWAAYARSDALMVRLYREEISPRLEILLDASRSMTSGPEGIKSRLACQLAAMFGLLSGQTGGRPVIRVMDDSAKFPALELGELQLLSKLDFAGRETLPNLLAQRRFPLSRQSVRIVISDFLFPCDPAGLIRRLASDASVLWVVQVLHGWEADPRPMGGRRLIDVETRSELNLMLNPQTIERYRQRLAALQAELMRQCRRAHASFVTVTADDGLDRICRESLCPPGILRAG